MNVFNFFGSPPLSPADELLRYFMEQEELKCDPLYLGIVIGTVHLQFLRMSKQHEEESQKLIQSGKTPQPLRGIKISFKEDCSVKIEEPGLIQTAQRTILGEGRTELEYIRPHLVKFLRWFDYEKPMFQTILKVYKLGLQNILNGYLNEQCKEISITQNFPKRGGQELSPIQLKINIRTPETRAVIRLLKDDIDLLDKAIIDDKREEQQVIELKQKLEEEEQRYFPLHQLILIQEVNKSIDVYMSEQVKARWDETTLKGIVELFKANPNKAFNRVESLSLLVSNNPVTHHELKKKIRELITSTLLSHCTIND